MKLTKYQHACFTVELDGQVLLVDPGNLTTDLPAIENLVAVVLTHSHPDHVDSELIARLVDGSVAIYGHDEVIGSLDGIGEQAVAVQAGDSLTLGPFKLDFFGGDHAAIHSSIPIIANLGLVINDSICYPGDSFARPINLTVNLLMLPIAAPWMKLSEAIDYANQLKPQAVAPTHDAILSEAGKTIADRVVSNCLVSGITYKRQKEYMI